MKLFLLLLCTVLCQADSIQWGTPVFQWGAPTYGGGTITTLADGFTVDGMGAWGTGSSLSYSATRTFDILTDGVYELAASIFVKDTGFTCGMGTCGHVDYHFESRGFLMPEIGSELGELAFSHSDSTGDAQLALLGLTFTGNDVLDLNLSAGSYTLSQSFYGYGESFGGRLSATFSTTLVDPPSAVPEPRWIGWLSLLFLARWKKRPQLPTPNICRKHLFGVGLNNGPCSLCGCLVIFTAEEASEQLPSPESSLQCPDIEARS